MCIRYGRVNGRTRRSAGKSRDATGASEGRESRARIIERFYPKFPGWPSLVNSPAAVTGIEEAFLRKDAAPFPRRGPAVRIRLAPAASPLRTRLPRSERRRLPEPWRWLVVAY